MASWPEPVRWVLGRCPDRSDPRLRGLIRLRFRFVLGKPAGAGDHKIIRF